MPNLSAWNTPKDWCFGFGFCFPAESKLPLGGYFIKSPAEVYLCIGPLTISAEFGEKEMFTSDIEDIREEYRDALQEKS